MSYNTQLTQPLNEDFQRPRVFMDYGTSLPPPILGGADGKFTRAPAITPISLGRPIYSMAATAARNPQTLAIPNRAFAPI